MFNVLIQTTSKWVHICCIQCAPRNHNLFCSWCRETINDGEETCMMNVGGKRVIRHKHDCSSKNDRNVIVMSKPVIVPFTRTPQRDETDNSQSSQSSDGFQMSQDSEESQNSQRSFDSTRYIRSIVSRKHSLSPVDLSSALGDDAAVVEKANKKKK